METNASEDILSGRSTDGFSASCAGFAWLNVASKGA